MTERIISYVEFAQMQYDEFINNGGTIEINRGIPYVAINFGEKDGSIEFFFQGEEAQSLIDEVPDYINEKVYLVHRAIDW